jgi:xylulokinase
MSSLMPESPAHATGAERWAIGIDVGTSAVKATVIADDGSSGHFTSPGYTTSSPRHGLAEQDPDDWWCAVGMVLEWILERYPALHADNAVIGLTGQMHTTVVRDRAGEAIRPAILWSDTRAAEQCRDLVTKTGAWEPLTGHAPIPAFTSAHLAWIGQHERATLRRLHTVAVPKDDVRRRLGAGWATEPSDASAMNLMDNRTDDWSDELLAAVGVDRRVVAPIVPSASLTGEVRSLPPMESDGRRLLGMRVIAGAGDQAAQAIALDVVEPGRLGISVGTSGVAFQAADTPRLGAFRHAVPATWLALESTHAAGLALAWWSGVSQTSFDALPTTIDTSLAPIFLPFLQGGRSGQGAPGTLSDLRATHDAGDIAVAVLEGVALELVRLALKVADRPLDAHPIGVGGGGASIRALRALLAAGLRRPVIYSSRGSAYGAACLAGRSVGVLDLERTPGLEIHDRVEASPELEQRFTARFGRYTRLVQQLS